MEQTKPLFEIGETAILQPPHHSAKAYWGMETVIFQRSWSGPHKDIFGNQCQGCWMYKTDIEAPPPTNNLLDKLRSWIWCEYDLRKKYDAGEDFKTLVKNLKKPLKVTELMYE